MALPESRLENYLAAMADPNTPCPHYPEATLTRVERLLEACVHEYKRLVEEVAKKNEFVELRFDGRNIKDESGQVMTYNDVQAVVIDKSKYAVLIYDELCLVPVFWLGDAIEFSETHIIDNEPYVNRIIINDKNQTKYEEIHLQKGN